MQNKLAALMQKLDSPTTYLDVCILASAIVGSAATVYFLKTRPHILDLSKEGYQALTSGEANNFIVHTAKHTFRIICED